MPNGETLISPEQSMNMMPQLPAQLDEAGGHYDPSGQLRPVSPAQPGTKESFLEDVSDLAITGQQVVPKERTAPTMEGAFPYEGGWMEDFMRSFYNEAFVNHFAGLTQLGVGLGKNIFKFFSPSDFDADVEDLVGGWEESISKWRQEGRVTLSDAANKVGRYKDDYLNANFIASQFGNFLGFVGGVGADVLLARGAGTLGGIYGRTAGVVSKAQRGGRLINVTNPVVGGTNASKILYSGRYGASPESLKRANDILKRAAKRKQTIAGRMTTTELEELQKAMKWGDMMKGIERGTALTATAGLIYGGAYEGAEAAGLPPEHRSLYALGLTLPMAALMYIPFGMAFQKLMPNGFYSSARNAAKVMAQDAAGKFVKGKPTKEFFWDTLHEAHTKFGKFYKGHMKEAFQAMKRNVATHAPVTATVMGLATAMDALGQEIYDKNFSESQAIVGQGKFGTEFMSPETLKHSIESALFGAMGGSLLGVLGGSARLFQSPATKHTMFHYLRKIKEEASTNPQEAAKKLDMVFNDIDAMAKEGLMDPNDANAIRGSIEEMMHIQEDAIWGIDNANAQYQAYNLIKLRKQFEGSLEKLQTQFGGDYASGEAKNRFTKLIADAGEIVADNGILNTLVKEIYDRGDVVSADRPELANLKEVVRRINEFSKDKRQFRIDEDFVEDVIDAGKPKMAFTDVFMEEAGIAAQRLGVVPELIQKKLGLLQEGLTGEKGKTFWDGLVEKRIVNKEQADIMADFFREAPEKFDESRVGQFVNEVVGLGKDSAKQVIDAMREKGLISEPESVSFKDILTKAKEITGETITSLSDALLGTIRKVREKVVKKVPEVAKKVVEVAEEAKIKAVEVLEAQVKKVGKSALGKIFVRKDINTVEDFEARREDPDVSAAAEVFRVKGEEDFINIRNMYDKDIKSAEKRGEIIDDNFRRQTLTDLLEAYRDMKEPGRKSVAEIIEDLRKGYKIQTFYDEVKPEFTVETEAVVPGTLFDVFSNNKSQQKQMAALKEMGLTIPVEFANRPLTYVFENMRLLTPESMTRDQLRMLMEMSRSKLTPEQKEAFKKDVHTVARKISKETMTKLADRIRAVDNAVKSQEGTLREAWYGGKGRLPGNFSKLSKDEKINIRRQDEVINLGPKDIVEHSTPLEIVNTFNPGKKAETIEDISVKDLLKAFAIARENLGYFNEATRSGDFTLLDLTEMDMITPGVHRGTSMVKSLGYESIRQALGEAQSLLKNSKLKLQDIRLQQLIDAREAQMRQARVKSINQSFFFSRLADKATGKETVGALLEGVRDKSRIIEKLGMIHPVTGEVLTPFEVVAATNEFFGQTQIKPFRSVNEIPVNTVGQLATALTNKQARKTSLRYIFESLGMDATEFTGTERVRSKRMAYNIVRKYIKEEPAMNILRNTATDDPYILRGEDIISGMELRDLINQRLGADFSRIQDIPESVWETLGRETDITHPNVITAETFQKASKEAQRLIGLKEVNNLLDLSEGDAKTLGFSDRGQIIQEVIKNPNTRHLIKDATLSASGKESMADVTPGDVVKLNENPKYVGLIKKSMFQPILEARRKERVAAPFVKVERAPMDPTAGAYRENPDIAQAETGYTGTFEEVVTKSFNDVKNHARENYNYALGRYQERTNVNKTAIKKLRDKDPAIYDEVKSKLDRIDELLSMPPTKRPGDEIAKLKKELDPSVIKERLEELAPIVRRGSNTVAGQRKKVESLEKGLEMLRKRISRAKVDAEKSALRNERESLLETYRGEKDRLVGLMKEIQGIKTSAERGKPKTYSQSTWTEYSNAVHESTALGKVLESIRLDRDRRNIETTVDNIRTKLDIIDNSAFTVEDMAGINRSVYKFAREQKAKSEILLDTFGTLEEVGPLELDRLGFKNKSDASEMFQRYVLEQEYDATYPWFKVGFKDLVIASEKMKQDRMHDDILSAIPEELTTSSEMKSTLERALSERMGYTVKLESARHFGEMFKTFSPEERVKVADILRKDGKFMAMGEPQVGTNRSPVEAEVTKADIERRRAMIEELFRKHDPKKEISDNSKSLARTYITQFDKAARGEKINELNTERYAEELISSLAKDAMGEKVQIPLLRNINSRELGAFDAIQVAFDRLSRLDAHVDPNFTLIDNIPIRKWIDKFGDSPSLKARYGESPKRALLREYQSVLDNAAENFKDYQARPEYKIFNKEYQEVEPDGISNDTFAHVRDNPEAFKKIVDILKKLYPGIKLIEKADIKGEKNPKARGTYSVLIDNQGNAISRMIEWSTSDARLETVPHEYAHHYMEMFEADPFIQNQIAKLAPNRTAEGMKAGKERLANAMADHFVEMATGIRKGDVSMNQAAKNPLFMAAKQVWNWLKSLFGSGEVYSELAIIQQGFKRGTAPKRLRDLKMRKSEHFRGYTTGVVEDAHKIKPKEMASLDPVKVFNEAYKGGKEVNKKSLEQFKGTVLGAMKTLKDLRMSSKFARETLDDIVDLMRSSEREGSKGKILKSLLGEKIKLSANENRSKYNIQRILQKERYARETEGVYFMNNNSMNHMGDLSKQMAQEASATQAFLDTMPAGSAKTGMKYMFSKFNVLQSHLFGVSKLMFGSEDSVGHKMLFGQFFEGERRKSELMGVVKSTLQQGIGDRSMKEWSTHANGDVRNIKEISGKEFSINNGKDKLYLSEDEVMGIHGQLRQDLSLITMKKGDPASGMELKLRDVKKVKGRENPIHFKLTEKEAGDIMKYAEEKKSMIESVDATYRQMHSMIDPTYAKMEGMPLGKRANFRPRFRDLDREVSEPGFSKIENATFGYQRTMDTTKPLEVGSVIGELSAYMNTAANYYAFAVPIRNTKLFLKSDAFKNVKFSDTAGTNAKTRLTEFMNEQINEIENPQLLYGIMRDRTVFDKLLTAFPIVALGYNPWVSLKQAASYVLSNSTMDRRHLMVGLRDIPNVSGKGFRKWGKEKHLKNLPKVNETISTAVKYSPIIRERLQGAIHKEMGDAYYQDVNWLTGEDVAANYHILGRRIKAHPLLRRARAMDWIKIVDTSVVSAIWKSSESEVQELFPDLKTGSDPYYQAVARRAEDIIQRTQPTFNATWRTGFRRKRDLFWRGLNMFTAQSTKNYNNMVDGIWDYHVNGKTKDNSRKMRRALAASLLFQPMVLGTVSAAQGLAYGFTDVDDLPADQLKNAMRYGVGSIFGARMMMDMLTSRSLASGVSMTHPVVDIGMGVADVMRNMDRRSLGDNAFKLVYEGAPWMRIPRTPISFARYTLGRD